MRGSILPLASGFLIALSGCASRLETNGHSGVPASQECAGKSIRSVYEALMLLDDNGTADDASRDLALSCVRDTTPNESAENSYYRAVVFALAAERKGLKGVGLVKSAYRLARSSQQLDPALFDGAAQGLAATIQGMAGERLGLGDSEDAIAELETLVRQFPGQPEHAFHLGQVLAALGDEEGALEQFCREDQAKLPPRMARRQSKLVQELGDCHL